MHHLAAIPVLALLGGCTGFGPVPGTPEYAAAQVSRCYDCGLRPDRQRILSRLAPDERRRFTQANAVYAVRSYNAPRACGLYERSRVSSELNGLVRR
jgi:hypothetical protein